MPHFIRANLNSVVFRGNRLHISVIATFDHMSLAFAPNNDESCMFCGLNRQSVSDEEARKDTKAPYANRHPHHWQDLHFKILATAYGGVVSPFPSGSQLFSECITVQINRRCNVVSKTKGADWSINQTWSRLNVFYK